MVEDKFSLAVRGAYLRDDLQAGVHRAIAMYENYVDADKIWADRIFSLTLSGAVWERDPAMRDVMSAMDLIYSDHSYERDIEAARTFGREKVIEVARAFNKRTPDIRITVANAFVSLAALEATPSHADAAAAAYSAASWEKGLSAEALAEIGNYVLKTWRDTRSWLCNDEDSISRAEAFAKAFKSELPLMKKHSPEYWASIAAMAAEGEIKPEEILSITPKDILLYRSKRLAQAWDSGAERATTDIDTIINEDIRIAGIYKKPEVPKDERRRTAYQLIAKYKAVLMSSIKKQPSGEAKAVMCSSAEAKMYRFFRTLSNARKLMDRHFTADMIIAAAVMASQGILPHYAIESADADKARQIVERFVS